MQKTHDRTVLVIEDEPDVAMAFKMGLEDSGFQAYTAANGLEALDAMRQHEPDLITLDLVMPRMSGLKFYRHLRRNAAWDHIPVIVVTAHASDDLGSTDFQEILSDQMPRKPEAWIEKPVKIPQYVEAVMKQLNVEIGEDSLDRADPALLRAQAGELLDDAAPQTLREVLRLLRSRQP